MAIDPTCPNCGSKTTQSVVMLVQSGTTTRNTTGVAVGGIGRRRGGGVHTSTSTTKSSLVASYAPPAKPTRIPAVLAFIVGGPMMVGGATNPVLGMIGLAVVIIGVFQWRKMPARRIEWEKQMERLNALWVCKKCGNEWTPAT